MWSRETIVRALQRDGRDISVAIVGRILRRPVERGAVAPVPQLRRKALSAPRRIKRTHARRLPKGMTSRTLGEIVQVDAMTINPGHGRPVIKRFAAAGPAGKWTCGRAFRSGAARNTERFLTAMIEETPFPVKAIQVDGGSDVMAELEITGKDRKLPAASCRPDRPNPTAMSNVAMEPDGMNSTAFGSWTARSRKSTSGRRPRRRVQ